MMMLSGQPLSALVSPQKRNSLDPPDRLGVEEGGRVGVRGVCGKLRLHKGLFRLRKASPNSCY